MANSDHADIAIIITNDSSTTSTDRMVRYFKQVETSLTLEIFAIDQPTGSPGYNEGLRRAREKGNYKYYWFTSNDVGLESIEVIEEMIRVADQHPELVVLCPSQTLRGKPGFHLVVSCPCSPLLINATTLKDDVFLNPAFQYSPGAMEEFSYKLYASGQQMACCDHVCLSPANPGAPGSSTETEISRANQFAVRYFVEHYSKNWDREFSKVLPTGLPADAYTTIRHQWEGVLDEQERKSYQPVEDKGGKHHQIEALHPWFYPVEIDGITVSPGVGTHLSAEYLSGRIDYRQKLVVEEVAKGYSFTNKRLLEIASNCAYWSARYAELGAVSLVAVEGRLDYVKQGQLYWEQNQFMKPGAYQFIHGNVMAAETWQQINTKAPFDFTICCGILYHIPDYEQLLNHIARVTTEGIIIDTRVSTTEQEVYIEEPGGLSFDAIIETRRKKVPNQERLIQLIQNLGFQTEFLSTDDPLPPGLKGADDYKKGKRVTILALKTTPQNLPNKKFLGVRGSMNPFSKKGFGRRRQK